MEVAQAMINLSIHSLVAGFAQVSAAHAKTTAKDAAPFR
jgi:hypothetical protein